MHGAAPGAAVHARFEGSTKSTLGHPELSKDGVPQLAGDARLRACSLLATRELASCNTETAFQTASSKPRKKGIFFFWPVMKTKGKWGSHIYDLGRNFTIHSNRKGVF